MTLENPGLSRRKLLRTTAIGVPAAGMLAFGSTLVTATSANAISTDGWWGSETSLGLQKFMNAIMTATWSDEDGEVTAIPTVVDGVISSQPSSMAPSCPGIVGGWEWVPDDQADGSPTIYRMQEWLTDGLSRKDENVDRDPNATPPSPRIKPLGTFSASVITSGIISLLQQHYGISRDGRFDAPSQTIQALQNEINQYV